METVSFARGRRLVTAAAVLVALVVGAAPGSARAACTGSLEDCVDEFTCYYVLPSPNSTPFAAITGLGLVDQFGSALANVRKPKHLCTPSDREGTGTLDEDTHLEAYIIKQTTPFTKRSPVRVTNTLEEIRLELHRPDLLLVPTNKTLTQPGPPPPDLLAIEVDHYKCYRVHVVDKTPLAEINRKVMVADQFSAGRLLTVRKPRHLCTPVDKAGEGIKHPDLHLLCYAARPARNEPKHLPRAGLFTSNQFGSERLDTFKEKEFCVPSSKSLSPSGAFLDPGPFE